MKKFKITKEGVLTFLGVLISTAVTTLFARIQSKRDMQETVQAVLAEERRQIAKQEANNAKD